jgi:hypothetical protein
VSRAHIPSLPRAPQPPAAQASRRLTRCRVTLVYATCRFTLNRDAYRNSVVESIKRQRAAREEFIAQVKTFAKLRPNQRAKIADALQKVSFAAGEQIINQGDDGDLFYIIEKGDVIITVRLFIRRLFLLLLLLHFPCACPEPVLVNSSCFQSDETRRFLPIFLLLLCCRRTTAI